MVIDEQFNSGHAEPVPESTLEKSVHSVFYLSINAVSNTTTKIRAVFDAFTKTSSVVSFNNTLLVGFTVHSSLINILLSFHSHHMALITDVSHMYQAIALLSVVDTSITLSGQAPPINPSETMVLDVPLLASGPHYHSQYMRQTTSVGLLSVVCSRSENSQQILC